MTEEIELNQKPTTDDEAASLAALQAGAVAAPDPVAEAETEKQLDNSKAESTLIVTLFAAGLSAKWPCLTYDDATRETVASKLAPVMQKYGLNNEWFAKFGAEIELLSAVAVIGFQSWQLVKAEKTKEIETNKAAAPAA